MTRMPVITNNFDFAGGIQADRLGRRDGLEIKRQNDTQTLGQHLASGNTGQAAKFALNNGMVNEGMKLQGMERERAAEAAKKKADRLASLVYAADTPDKWGQMIGRLKQTGVNLPDQYNDFGSRDMVLAEYAGLTGVKAARADRRADAEFGLKQQETRLDIGKKQRELHNMNNPAYDLGGFKDKKQKLSAQGDFRKEFTKVSGDFVKVRDAQGRIEASAKDPSAAGDLALIFNYMKVLDPGSTVREGEFATAQNSAGVPSRVVAIWNSLLSGQRLGPEQRSDFLNRARSLYKRQEQQYNKTRGIYEGIARRSGLDVESVLPDLSIVQEAGSPDAGSGKQQLKTAVNPNTGERIVIDTVTGQRVK